MLDRLRDALAGLRDMGYEDEKYVDPFLPDFKVETACQDPSGQEDD